MRAANGNAGRFVIGSEARPCEICGTLTGALGSICQRSSECRLAYDRRRKVSVRERQRECPRCRAPVEPGEICLKSEQCLDAAVALVTRAAL